VAKLMGVKRLERAMHLLLRGQEDLTEVAEKSSSTYTRLRRSHRHCLYIIQ
jgi:hypothetical protein